MNEMQLFENPEFGTIRFIEVGEKPYAVGLDVAKMLEYTNPSKAVIDHCKGITKLVIPSPGGGQITNCIPEGDIYRLIVKAADQSKNPKIQEKASRIESWIFDEVLPSIRKHGMYAKDELLNNPDLMIEILTQIKEERQKRIEAEQQKNTLQTELDRSKEWFSIKRVAAINGVNWKTFNWRKLKKISDEIGQPSRKIFDANYGEVNIYHAKAWEKAYPEYEL